MHFNFLPFFRQLYAVYCVSPVAHLLELTFKFNFTFFKSVRMGEEE